MELQKRFDAVLTEKERLFTKTQPNAITYDKDHVQMSHDGNVLEDYVIALETGEIDKKIDNLRGLLDDRGKLLRLKEEELRKTHAVNNGVAKYTLDGELICVYTSLAQAARDVSKESDRYYIRKCCRNELDQFKNFKFKYYDLR